MGRPDRGRVGRSRNRGDYRMTDWSCGPNRQQGCTLPTGRAPHVSATPMARRAPMKHISINVVPCCLALTAFGCSPSASVSTPTAEPTHSGDAASPTETVVDAGGNADVEQAQIDDGGGGDDVGAPGGWQPGTGDGGSTAAPEAGGPPVQIVTASIGPDPGGTEPGAGGLHHVAIAEHRARLCRADHRAALERASPRSPTGPRRPPRTRRQRHARHSRES